MADEPISIPELGYLNQAVTLAVSDAGWRAMFRLVDDALRPAAQPFGRLYLRGHNGRFEFLFVDQDRFATVYPELSPQGTSVSDFSIEVDPELFAVRPSGDGELTVTPRTGGGHTFAVSAAGVEIGRSQTAGFMKRWISATADVVGHRVVNCPTEALRRAIVEVMDASERPALGRLDVDAGHITVSSAEPAAATVPIGPNSHVATFDVNLHYLKWLTDHFWQDSVDLLLPAEGWSAVAMRADGVYGAIRTPDPFVEERIRLGQLLTAAVAKLPRDARGRHFVGVREIGSRIYFDVVAARVGDATSDEFIRLQITVGEPGERVTLESRLDLSAATPELLVAAIETISDEAARYAGLDNPPPIVDPRLARYREHLTAQQCNTLLHHSHWIPINRGFTAAYVADNFPGWTWNELVKVFIAAGIHVRKDGPSAKVDDRVKSFHFSSATEFHVEWIDGVEPADIAAKRQANDLTQGHWAYDAGSGATFASLGGSRPPK